jgi:hypothetical protein
VRTASSLTFEACRRRHSVGLIAGFVASKIVNAPGEGVLFEIVLGIVGGFIFDAAGGIAASPAPAIWRNTPLVRRAF